MVRFNERTERLQPWRKRSRLWICVDIDKAVPDFELYHLQPTARGVEVGGHVSRLDERPISIVNPAVIRTSKPFGVAASARDLGQTMRANIEHRSNFTRIASNDDNRNIDHFGREVVPSKRQLIGAADAKPLVLEKRLQLEFKQAIGCVNAAGHG